MERDLRTLRRSKVFFETAQAYVNFVLVRVKRLHNAQVSMILIKPPDDLCFLLLDSVMISLVYKITATSAGVEIPFR